MNRAKTRQELAAEFGVSTKTFYRWIRREKMDLPKGLVSIKEQERIYQIFGKPKGQLDFENEV